MVQKPRAPERLHLLRGVDFAKLLLGFLLIISGIALDADSTVANETVGPSSASAPDFSFRQPRVTFGLRAGYAFNRSNGEIYDFLRENLTLRDSDFDSGVFAMDVGVRVVSWLDVVFGFEYSRSSARSEFRDFVDASGDAIDQRTRVTQVPLTTSLKFYPIGRGRRVGNYAWIRSTLAPYVGGGIGGTWYKLKQKGDFVDFVDLTIFEGEFESDEWGFAQHVFAGLDLALPLNFSLVVEGRYYWSHADLEQDYVGFDDINLDGARAMIGLNWSL
jgi:opacity protein-like surface antigen